ncbi:MAG: hypothetical protein IJJ69_00630 [Oscillospiraceae bacterium]|nr:hypothetical protein [Oscillospiraceae bacterium]
MKKFIRICLEILLLITAVIFPGFMAMLSASGWKYNVRQGKYPEIFSVYSFWMFLGAVLVLIAVLCCFIGKKPKFYILNLLAVISDIAGTAFCMTVLKKFCAYADQNFSGIGESMKPVSELYQDRLLPIGFPAFLVLILAVWNFLESREYRIEKKNQKLAELNAEAPKILQEEEN